MEVSGIKIAPPLAGYASAEVTQQSLLDLALEVRSLAAATRERAVDRANALCGTVPMPVSDKDEGGRVPAPNSGVFDEIRAALNAIRKEVIETRDQIERIVP